ncbi:MAG TPA: hypothetical protein VF053_15240 [Streptosporangiales bacterium]
MRTRRSLSAAAASLGLAAAVAALVAGCGAGATGDSGATASATSSVAQPSSSSASPPATTSPTTGPTVPSGTPSTSKPPLTTGGKATLTGTAVRGAEPGCVGLKTSDGRSYELAGDAPRQLAQGGGGGYQAKLGKVRVTGHFASAGMASHCMMGRIFVVSKLEKLS